MKYLYLALLSLCLCPSLVGQDVTYETYDLSEVINSPSLLEFAELEDGTAYLSYRYFGPGRLDHAMLEFDGMTWSPIDTLCRGCVDHIVAGPDGLLYVAAREEGIFRRVDDAWEQVLTDTAFHLAFDPAGVLHFLNEGGVFAYDSNVVSAGNTAGLPAGLTRISEMEFRADGTLYFIKPATLYSYTAAGGFTERTEVTSPIFLADHPDGSMYVATAFGSVHVFRGEEFERNVAREVFTSRIAFFGFDISNDGVIWGSEQGFNGTVKGYDGSRVTEEIIAKDLLPGAILIGPLHAGASGRVYAASDQVEGVAIIKDELTSVFAPDRALTPLGLSPNPASGSVTVDISLPANSSGHFYVRDVTGRTLRTIPVIAAARAISRTVSLAGLSPGVYTIEARFGRTIGISSLVVR